MAAWWWGERQYGMDEEEVAELERQRSLIAAEQIKAAEVETQANDWSWWSFWEQAEREAQEVYAEIDHEKLNEPDLASSYSSACILVSHNVATRHLCSSTCLPFFLFSWSRWQVRTDNFVVWFWPSCFYPPPLFSISASLELVILPPYGRKPFLHSSLFASFLLFSTCWFDFVVDGQSLPPSLPSALILSPW